MTEEVAVFTHVTKRYGNHRAMNDLSWSAPGNRIVGVLGPNGSGKSTLFRLMTGLTRAESGDIKVFGKNPGWATNRNIAYLPDRARWYSHQSVSQAFDYAQRLLPGFDRAAAERLAEMMKISPNMRACGMSKGQEARLMLILCIARNVPLIILDEPFSGIDTVSREQIIDGLIHYMSEVPAVQPGSTQSGGSYTGGRTVLISTHEIYEAESLFDYAVFLNEGQVLLSGEADELRGRYGSMRSILKKLYV
jgi:ABC-2 type transport system ATP-binding protein